MQDIGYDSLVQHKYFYSPDRILSILIETINIVNFVTMRCQAIRQLKLGQYISINKKVVGSYSFLIEKGKVSWNNSAENVIFCLSLALEIILTKIIIN